MAVLPSENDLRRAPIGANTPNIRVGQIDYGPALQGDKAIAEGVGQVGKGFEIIGQAQAEVDDYDTRKRLLDFKLDSEMALERMKRDMPAGGAGYAEAWQAEYQRRAREFVGKDDSLIPQTQRAKVGMALKQHEVALSERAQRYALAEEDRFHVDGLELQLGKVRDVVGANPERRGEMAEEGRKQIELSRIPQAAKHQLLKKFEKELDKTQATARIMAPKTVEAREAFKSELRLDQEDIANPDVSKTLTSGIAKGKAAGWAATDPTWAKLSPFQKAAAMALLEADGANPADARNALGAMINRAAKKGEDLGAHVSQAIYQPTIEPVQRERLQRIVGTSAFSDLTSWAERRASGAEPDPVNGATHFLASEKTMLALEAKEPQKYRSWRKWTGFNGSEYNGVITRDGSHAFLAPEGKHENPVDTAQDPNRSYANLSLMERREIWNKYEGEFKKEITQTDTLIKHLGERSANGDLPPQVELDTIAARVKSLGDPALVQKYQATVALADHMNKVFALPPQVAEAHAKQLRTQIMQAQDGRVTEDQEKLLKNLDKAAETVRKSVNEDAMGWSHRRRLEVPTGDYITPGVADETGQMTKQPMRKIELKPLNFNAPTIDVDLAERLSQAKDVARYQGQALQVFTKNERDALKDMVNVGGAPLVGFLGKVVSVAGTDALDVLREFSKDAPEAYMIGKLMHEGGDEYLIKTAADEIKKRAKDGEKYINKVDRKLSEPDVAALMPAIQMTPGMVDPVKHMTDLLYNFEHRRQGKDQFDATLYKDTMRKVLGERKDAKGNVYGGVGDQGNAWFGLWPDGKSSSKVQVPSEVRQDSFDAMVNAVRLEDFGGNVPAFDNKQPMSLRDIQTSQWRSLGNGRYALYLGQNEEGKDKFAGDAAGNFYVLDIKPMLGKIRQRKPEIFDSAAPMRLADDQLDTLDQIIPYLSKVGKDYQPGPNESDMVDDQRPSTLLTKGYNLKPSVHRPARIDDTPEQLRNLLPN